MSCGLTRDQAILWKKPMVEVPADVMDAAIRLRKWVDENRVADEFIIMGFGTAAAHRKRPAELPAARKAF